MSETELLALGRSTTEHVAGMFGHVITITRRRRTPARELTGRVR